MENWKKAYQKMTGKAYILMLSLTALFGYGFKVCHPTIGIDDTPYSYYFEEGLAAIVGRWMLFLLNKIVHISEYAPFLTDLAAVLILMAAVTIWALLFYRILGDRIPRWGYWLFACIFISCPLISEVFTYFLHNGIAIGYLCGGCSLCLFRDMLDCFGESGARNKKKACGLLLGSVGLLVAAMGCYESFMVVWLTGLLLMLLSERMAGIRRPVIKGLLAAAGCAVAAMLMRSLVIAAVTGIFRLQYLRDDAVQRSMAELTGWVSGEEAWALFGMALKRCFVMYGVFAYAYYPIRIFVLASAVIVLYGVWQTIRRRDGWILPLTLAAFAACFLLVLLEGKATLYRSAQFLPLICAYGALLFVCASAELGAWASGWKSERLRAIGVRGTGVCAILILSVVLWNQCADLNKWFYVDYRKYEYCREMAGQIAYELERNYDIEKPVFFTGTWECPKSIIEDAYVDYGTKTFFKMKRITDRVDEHLLEKFYRSYGVWVAQTPSLTVIDWARYAFGSDRELVKFFAMHGYQIQPFLDESAYEQAETYSVGLPVFPHKGSIVDMGEYIIVHLQ